MGKGSGFRIYEGLGVARVPHFFERQLTRGWLSKACGAHKSPPSLSCSGRWSADAAFRNGRKLKAV